MSNTKQLSGRMRESLEARLDIARILASGHVMTSREIGEALETRGWSKSSTGNVTAEFEAGHFTQVTGIEVGSVRCLLRRGSMRLYYDKKQDLENTDFKVVKRREWERSFERKGIERQ